MSIVKGFKATNAEMKCQGYQFTLGEWHEYDGELELCKSGFHFCTYPSGVWAYYDDPGTRVFEVEAEGVLDLPVTPGADYKMVARKIRLVREVVLIGYGNTGDGNTGHWNTGDRNTGYGNTGHWNTGDCNTGYRNTGYGNTGNCNTGDRNTGDRNTGDRNTGDRNTGDGNTGDRNTGDRNTGDRNTGNGNTGDMNTGNGNTGHWNTGDWNTGDWNTGHGNATNYSAGFFCTEQPTVRVFDIDSALTREQFMAKYPKWIDLCDALTADDPIPFEPFADIPGITPEKLQRLHGLHKAGRAKGKEDDE